MNSCDLRRIHVNLMGLWYGMVGEGGGDGE